MTLFLRPFRRLAVAAATAATTAMALVPAHAAAPAATTAADLSWTGSVVEVDLESPRAACEDDRRVVFIHNRGRAYSAISGTTNRAGILRFDPAYGAGTLRAYATRTPACRPAQSDAVTRTDAGPEMRRAARTRTSATITLIAGGARVKVSSPKPACVRGRKVDAVQYDLRSPTAFAISGTTDRNGVVRLTGGSARGTTAVYKITAFVRVAPGCALGQANTLTYRI